MELGTSGKKGGSEGWLSRHLKHRGLGSHSFEAVTIGALAPVSLQGFESAAVVNGLGGASMAGALPLRTELEGALRSLYEGCDFGLDALESLQRLEAAAKPPEAAAYPKGEIGNRLKTLAQLVRMNLGIRAATVDMGGW